jgi:8-amino-7-oxononanoate synthase
MAGPPGIKARARGFAEVFDRSVGDALTPLSVVIEKVLSPVRAVIEGRETLMFGTNSYLGLNFDPSCLEAAGTAMASFGTGSTASRVASGNQALHVGLERDIAGLYGRRDAVVFSTGFMANLGAIGGLVREGDALVLDAHCHASIFDAGKLSGAKILTFKHNDATDLERVIAGSGIAPSRTLVIVEGLYSVLGDIADLEAVSSVTQANGAVLLVDEAHSLGLYGARGRGVAEAQGIEDRVDVIVGTFSKSVGVIGGYCVTDDPAFRALRFAARSYLYTASLPPPVVAAARQALAIIRDDKDRRPIVFRNAEIFHRGLTALGLPPLAAPGPVGAVRMPGIKAGLDTWTALLRAGLYVNMLIPPATPNGEVVLRYSVSAAHSERDIASALDIIAATGRQTGVLRPAA